MNRMYPIHLNLENKRCVIAGGGRVAYGKLLPLLHANAKVRVVCPELIPELEALSDEGSIEVRRKHVEPADYEDAFLIVAATDDPEVNREIYERVKDTKLVNVATDAELGNFHLPATIKRGRLQISVATSGASPMLAKRIRDELAVRYDESYEAYTEFLYNIRSQIKQQPWPNEKKQALYREALDDKYRFSKEERRLFLERYLH